MRTVSPTRSPMLGHGLVGFLLFNSENIRNLCRSLQRWLAEFLREDGIYLDGETAPEGGQEEQKILLKRHGTARHIPFFFFFVFCNSGVTVSGHRPRPKLDQYSVIGPTCRSCTARFLL